MQYVTNGEFGILLIPECKQYSVSEIGSRHNMTVRFDKTDVEYIVPFRKSYDRIIRGIGADMHEIMYDNKFVNLNVEKWSEVREKCLDYITSWFDSLGHLPINKHFCHTAYFKNYVGDIDNYILLDVDEFDLLPKYLKDKYNFELGEIPELPENFYEHTVPYWEIETLYNSHKKMRTLIDDWCALDQKLLTTTVVNDLFLNA